VSGEATIGAPTAAPASCRLDLTGLDCADCARTVASSLSAMPGVRDARVSFPSGAAEISYDPARVEPAEFVERIRALGYDVRDTAAAPWVFDVSGMDCADCARTIEAGVRRLPGVRDATVNLAAATLTVVPGGDELTPDAVIAAVTQAGYEARPRTASSSDPAERAWWRRRRVLETAIAAGLWLGGLAMELADASGIAVALFAVAMVVAGYPVARAAWFALRARRADMNVLMTLAAIGAAAIGEWEEASSVLILFAIGLTLQTMTIERTRRAIQALLNLAPAEATVRRDGREERVPVASVAVGETVVVRPGERIPVDGVVMSGRSAVDQSPITGESIPVVAEPQSEVYAGTINGDGVLDVRATAVASDTTLARIIHLVEEAQTSRAPAQAFVDRFAAVYTPLVVGFAILLATAVPLVVGDFQSWFFRALVLLVVACPCALVISTPVALVAAIGSASRRGVLFKGGAAIEALARVRAVVLDKTGTLTAGRPVVTDVIPLGERSVDEVLARAAAVEQGSTHPVARGIVRAARERSLTIPAVSDAEGIPGQGARGVVEGASVTVGSARLITPLPPETQAVLADLERAGKTAVLVATESGVEGIIALADAPRPAARRAVAALHALGMRTVMLTGDNRPAAERIGSLAGVSDVRAGLLPDEKRAEVLAIERETPVAMIGDGVNDAPALAAASVGVAMGAAGADVAIEAADVVLMGDDLVQMPVAIHLARKTLATIRQNIAVSLLVKAAFVALTIAGVTNLWLAVLADMGTSLLVTANALRLLRLPAPAQALHEPAPALVTSPVGDD